MKNNFILFIQEIKKFLCTKKLKTRYSHHNIAKKHRLYLDCSELIEYILKKTQNKNAFSEILQYNRSLGFKNNRIFVKDFFRFFEAIERKKTSSDFWQNVNLENIKNGDIVFYEKAKSTRLKRHIFIIEKKIANAKFEILHSAINKNKSGVQIENIYIKNNKIFFESKIDYVKEMMVIRLKNKSKGK